MATHVSLEQAGGWVLGLSRAMPEAAKKGLYAAGLRISQHLAADGSIPNDRGTVRAGWRVEPTEEGAEIFNVAPEYPFIDGGVRAANVKIGRAMINAIAEWARRKGLSLEGPEGTKPNPKKKPAVDMYLPVAWAIAQSMKKRGIFQPPKHYLENAVKLLGPGYVREEVVRALKEEFLK